MSLAAGTYTFLSAGLSVGNRVYPLTLPQNATLPALTHQLVSELPVPTHQWAQGNPLYDGTRYKQARVQFNAYGDTFDEAESLSNELEALITGYRGLWGDVQVESVLPVYSLDDYEPNVGKWRRITDYYITFIGGQA